MPPPTTQHHPPPTTNPTQPNTPITTFLTHHPFLTGLLLRITLTILLPLLLDDGILLQGVRYTDIDYDVFTDAAAHIRNGNSPFRRHTYRYTPFLAGILSWAGERGRTTNEGMKWWWWWRNERYFGKLLFSIADAVCGWMILELRRRGRDAQPTKKRGGGGTTKTDGSEEDDEPKPIVTVELQDALWWLYNPLAINICTRGSAESLVVLLPVLGTLAVVMSCPFSEQCCDTDGDDAVTTTRRKRRRRGVWVRAAIAGVLHGISVHAKLYPVIYTVSYMAYFGVREQRTEGTFDPMEPLLDDDSNGGDDGTDEPNPSLSLTYPKNRWYPFPWLNPKRLVRLVQLWIQRLLFQPSSLLFASTFLLTFGTLTYLAFYLYGPESLQEGLLYHFSRVDHRHNYSIFWYWIYLEKGRSASRMYTTAQATARMSGMGRILLLPQIVLLVYSSLGIAPLDLPFVLFLQTFLFVTHNKVFTAQYFTWYLCLLPLCADRIRWRTIGMVRGVVLLGVSIVVWLGCAFCLEMKGYPVYLQVWMASIGFFVCNTNLFRLFLENYKGNGDEEASDGKGLGLKPGDKKKVA